MKGMKGGILHIGEMQKRIMIWFLISKFIPFGATWLPLCVSNRSLWSCPKLGPSRTKSTMNFSLFCFSGPKDNFEMKTHPKLSNFPPTLFSRYKKIKPVNPKRNSKYSLEGLILKLKLQYSGHPMQRANSLEKTDAGKDWGQEEKRVTEWGKMVGWHQ